MSFFLLGDKLKDAVGVCVKNLNDFQLAIVLCRLYEGEDGLVLKDLLINCFLPDAFVKMDRYRLSFGYYLLKQRKEAILVLMVWSL